MRAVRTRTPIPSFADVAKLIALKSAPPWLPAHLEWWAQGVRHDLLFDDCQPARRGHEVRAGVRLARDASVRHLRAVHAKWRGAVRLCNEKALAVQGVNGEGFLPAASPRRRLLGARVGPTTTI